MMQTAAFERVGQRLHDMLLARELGERFRPPFAGEDLVTHWNSGFRRRMQAHNRSSLICRYFRSQARREEAAGAPCTNEVHKRLWLTSNKACGRNSEQRRGGEPDPRHLLS